LGENGDLNKIRKSIKASKQIKTKKIKDDIDRLINCFESYSVFINNSSIPIAQLNNIKTQFIKEDLDRIKPSDVTKFSGIMELKNYANTHNGQELFNYLRDIVTHKNTGRNHDLFKYKDLLIAKRKRGMRKNRDGYDVKIKLIDNLEEAAERFYNRTNANRNNRIEEEMSIIKSLNRNLYDHLLNMFENNKDRFKIFMRHLLKLDNRRDIYRLFSRDEIIDLIDCFIRVDEHIQRIKNHR
jgi:hypothetical protein